MAYRRATRVGLGGAALALLGLFVALRMEVTTDISHFLPAGQSRQLATVSKLMAESELTRTVILSMGSSSGDERQLLAGARAMAKTLEASPGVSWVHAGFDGDVQKAVKDLYFERRLLFLSDDPQQLSQMLSPAGLRKAAAQLKAELARPTGSAVRALAPQDPLLAFWGVIGRLKKAQSSRLTLREGQLMTEKGRAIVFLGTSAAAFDGPAQAAMQEEIHAAFDAANAQSGGELDLLQSAQGRFAIAAERAIKADITRISAVSMVGIGLLFLGLLRSFRALLLVFLPMAAGVLAALAVTLALFGRIHGVTLAFGATLIGVCIDFAVHLWNHHSLAPDKKGAEGTAQRVWPALALGALTTVAGLAGLAWTSLPGIREIAIFASVGVLSALLFTRYMLPPLLAAKPRPSKLQKRAAVWLGAALPFLERRRLIVALFPAGALVFSAAVLPHIEWNDDVSALNAMDPDLLEEEEAVRAQVSHVETSRLILALGATEEEALQKNDALYLELRAAQERGEVEELRSIHSLLWSEKLQRQNWDAISDAGVFDRLGTALEAEGFHAAPFAPFGKALEKAPVPLQYQDLLDSKLANMARPFRATVGEQVAILTFVRGVADPVALGAAVERAEGVIFFDQMRFLADMYSQCRTRTVELMILGLCAVFLMVLIRYRRLSLACAALFPALIAAATTLAIVVSLGMTVSLLHVLGLLLVLSMGVDYGVFLAESYKNKAELEATAMSLVIACASTVLCFGLLAMSQNPALRAMGLTTGTGVLLSLFFAPTTMMLLKPKESS